MTSGTPEPVLARDFDLAVNTGTDAAPVLTPVGGITNIQPQNNTTKTDDTDFDSGGRQKETVVLRGDSFQVDMLYKEDPATGALDAGQQAIHDAAFQIGAAAKKQFQYTTPGGITYAFTANVELPLPGGDKQSNSTWSATLTVDGDITETPAS